MKLLFFAVLMGVGLLVFCAESMLFNNNGDFRDGFRHYQTVDTDSPKGKADLVISTGRFDGVGAVQFKFSEQIATSGILIQHIDISHIKNGGGKFKVSGRFFFSEIRDGSGHATIRVREWKNGTVISKNNALIYLPFDITKQGLHGTCLVFTKSKPVNIVDFQDRWLDFSTVAQLNEATGAVDLLIQTASRQGGIIRIGDIRIEKYYEEPFTLLKKNGAIIRGRSSVPIEISISEAMKISVKIEKKDVTISEYIYEQSSGNQVITVPTAELSAGTYKLTFSGNGKTDSFCLEITDDPFEKE